MHAYAFPEQTNHGDTEARRKVFLAAERLSVHGGCTICLGAERAASNSAFPKSPRVKFCNCWMERRAERRQQSPSPCSPDKQWHRILVLCRHIECIDHMLGHRIKNSVPPPCPSPCLCVSVVNLVADDQRTGHPSSRKVRPCLLGENAAHEVRTA